MYKYKTFSTRIAAEGRAEWAKRREGEIEEMHEATGGARQVETSLPGLLFEDANGDFYYFGALGR